MNIHIENIIADIKRGNKQAFKKLFDDYYPILCVFASHYIEDKEVCKDIAQDVLLAYWERKEDFDDILKVKSFLYTVTRNKCLNHLKHEQLDIPYFSGQEEFDSGFEAAIIEPGNIPHGSQSGRRIAYPNAKYHLIFYERVKKP